MSKTLPGKSKRLLINAQDLMRAMSMHVRTAQRMIQRARIGLGKAKHGLVTIEEFCKYWCLKVEDLTENLIMTFLPVYYLLLKPKHI
jgi:hypothetical protein